MMSLTALFRAVRPLGAATAHSIPAQTMILMLRHPSVVPTVVDDVARAVAKDVHLPILQLAMPNLFAIRFVTISSRLAAKSRAATNHRVIPANREDAATVAVNQVAMIRVVVSPAAAKAREPKRRREIRCAKMNAVTNNVDESPAEVNQAVVKRVAVNPIVVKEAAVRDGLKEVAKGVEKRAAASVASVRPVRLDNRLRPAKMIVMTTRISKIPRTWLPWEMMKTATIAIPRFRRGLNR